MEENERDSVQNVKIPLADVIISKWKCESKVIHHNLDDSGRRSCEREEQKRRMNIDFFFHNSLHKLKWLSKCALFQFFGRKLFTFHLSISIHYRNFVQIFNFRLRVEWNFGRNSIRQLQSLLRRSELWMENSLTLLEECKLNLLKTNWTKSRRVAREPSTVHSNRIWIITLWKVHESKKILRLRK